MKIRRVAIIGISAVGKSTLGKHLSSRLGLPLVHMDQLWWKPNWEEVEEKVVRAKLQAVLTEQNWIIEGYIEPCGKEKIEKADLILYLDYGRWRALWQGFKRMFLNRKTKRSEMPEGCTDGFSLSYLKTIFIRAERSEIESVIKDLEPKITRLKSPKQTELFLKKSMIKN